MKLKLKCQLEWNENDIKTEPAAQAQAVTTHNNNKRSARPVRLHFH